MKISSSWPSLSVGYKFWQNLSDIAGRMPAVPAPTNKYKKVTLRSGFFAQIGTREIDKRLGYPTTNLPYL